MIKNVRFWKADCIFDVFTLLEKQQENSKTSVVVNQRNKLIKDGD